MKNFNSAVFGNFECKCFERCSVFDFYACGLFILNETFKTSPLCSDTLIIDRQAEVVLEVFFTRRKK